MICQYMAKICTDATCCVCIHIIGYFLLLFSAFFFSSSAAAAVAQFQRGSYSSSHFLAQCREKVVATVTITSMYLYFRTIVLMNGIMRCIKTHNIKHKIKSLNPAVYVQMFENHNYNPDPIYQFQKSKNINMQVCVKCLLHIGN